MRTLIIFASLVLAACGGGTEAPAVNENEGKASPPPPAAAAEPFKWTGRFAASKDLCKGGVWEFEESQVRTQGETGCSVQNVAEHAGSVTLSVGCTAEGMDTLEQWTLTPSEQGGMTVIRKTAGRQTAQVDLVRCD